MPFKRKESENTTQTKAYKFRIFPLYQEKDFDEETKKSIFAEARLMNNLWNRLVEIRRDTLIAYGEHYAEALKAAEVEDGEKLSAKQLRQISPGFASATEDLWKNYEVKIKAVETLPEIRENISWETREDVINRFEASHKLALKSGAEIKFASGFIQQFHFPHRFTGGGLDAAKIFSSRSKKLSIEPIDSELYVAENYQNRLKRVASGRFGVGLGDHLQIKFRIVMHRQLPQDAKIKTAVLTGKFKNRNWEYHLVLTVDEPVLFKASDFKLKEKIAAIDLGWRKFEDYIRFGVIADTEGNLFELRMPLNPGKNQSQRNFEKMLLRRGVKPNAYPQTWQDIEDWQAINDHRLERVKEQIQELELPPTETIKPILDHLVKVRKSGLQRLLKSLVNLEKQIERTSDEEKAISILEAWRADTEKIENAINHARDRLINFRNNKYQNLAVWLKNNYSKIGYEGDLRLQEMAVKASHASLLEENGAVLKNSAKFRTRIALHEFIKWLKQKELRGDNWLQAKKAAHTTTICSVCGSSCDKTAQLYIVCENGHKIDQDVQAAINIRNALADSFPSKKEKNTLIPEQLRGIVVALEV